MLKILRVTLALSVMVVFIAGVGCGKKDSDANSVIAPINLNQCGDQACVK